MDKIKPGTPILWKKYGFCHIVKDSEKTLCGNNYGWLLRRDADWAEEYAQKAETLASQGFVNKAIDMRRTAEYYRDLIKTGQRALTRPMCGTCRKLADKLKT